MDFSFDAKVFKHKLHDIVTIFLKSDAMNENSLDSESINSLNEQLAAMDQAIDIMQRAHADNTVQHYRSAETTGRLEQEDISRIGRYALDLLESLAAFLQNVSGMENRELQDMSLPLSLWIARNGGSLSQIDLLVNSLAAYANETTETHKLAELCAVIKEIIDACDNEIRRDIDQSNMMRPWRILNLNYGIVATRSYQPELIEQAYDTLIRNLPQDARGFFKESAQQMDIIGYPDIVRQVVDRYNKMWGTDGSLH